MSVAAAEGFRPIRCASCGGVVMAPLGPDFWFPASGGTIRSRNGVHCTCGNVIWQVRPEDIVLTPPR